MSSGYVMSAPFHYNLKLRGCANSAVAAACESAFAGVPGWATGAANNEDWLEGPAVGNIACEGMVIVEVTTQSRNATKI